MGLKKKREGVTFLEIVLALAIIGIISTAIFNNIYYSMRVNNMAEIKQNSSIVGQSAYESMENMGELKFKEMLGAFKEGTEFSFMDSQFEEVSDVVKEEFKDSGENIETFKVYKSLKVKGVFLKISLEKFDHRKDSFGIKEEFAVNGEGNNGYTQWKVEEDCLGIITFEKDNMDVYKITVKKNGTAIVSEWTKAKSETGKIEIKISQESGKVDIKSVDWMKEYITSGARGASLYIKNKTGEIVYITLENMERSKSLQMYVEEGKPGMDNIKFTTFGENIEIRSNDISEDPKGEGMNLADICKYGIRVYNEKNGDYEEVSSVYGYKKFKAFKKE